MQLHSPILYTSIWKYHKANILNNLNSMKSKNFFKSGYVNSYQITFSVLVALCFIFSCNLQKDPKTIIFNPLNVIEGEVFLSKFADDIIYIPLDNEILFQHPNRIITTNNQIFIATFPAGILSYDYKGTFINRIGSRGRGPGEYRSGMYFTFDSSEELIYIYDNKRILVYNTSGNYINNILVNEPEYVGDICFFEGMLFLAGGPRHDYDWVVYDTSGNLISRKNNELPRFQSGKGSSMGFSLSQEGLFYWNSYNDTIFLIKDESYEPSMYFAPGDFRLPFADYPREDFGKYFEMVTKVTTDNYIFLTYLLNEVIHTSYIDKNNGKYYLIGSGTDMSSFTRPGILNDIDNGPAFPIFYNTMNNEKEYLIGWIHPYRLKAHVESEAFRNSTPKFPEKKKELEKLAASLDENDNPVLMLVKLKD